MQPVFLTLAAVVLLGEKLNLKKGLCILVALCGMILISGVIGGGIPEARELTGIAQAGQILVINVLNAIDAEAANLFAAAVHRAGYHEPSAEGSGTHGDSCMKCFLGEADYGI